MHIVLDVNILASAAAVAGSLPDQIVGIIASGEHDLIASVAMIEKLEEVLERPYFSAKAPPDQRQYVVSSVRENAIFVYPDPTVTGVADDEEDDHILGTAVAAKADIIVTGDKGLLALRACRGIPIVSAREFLVLVED